MGQTRKKRGGGPRGTINSRELAELEQSRKLAELAKRVVGEIRPKEARAHVLSLAQAEAAKRYDFTNLINQRGNLLEKIKTAKNDIKKMDIAINHIMNEVILQKAEPWLNQDDSRRYNTDF